jgi:hypothetical protein
MPSDYRKHRQGEQATRAADHLSNEIRPSDTAKMTLVKFSLLNQITVCLRRLLRNYC